MRGRESQREKENKKLREEVEKIVDLNQKYKNSNLKMRN